MGQSLGASASSAEQLGRAASRQLETLDRRELACSAWEDWAGEQSRERGCERPARKYDAVSAEPNEHVESLEFDCAHAAVDQWCHSKLQRGELSHE